MDHWDTSISRKAYDLDIIERHRSVVIGATSPPVDAFDEAGGLVARLLRLMCTLPARRFSGSLRRMAEALGFSEAAVTVLDRFSGEPLSHEVFCRADLLRECGRWRLLELNIGSLTGGMCEASLPRLVGQAQGRDVLKLWAEHTVARHNLAGKRIAFVTDSSIAEEIQLPLSVYSEEFARAAGVQIPILGAGSLFPSRPDATRLTSPEVVYCRFNEDFVVRSPGQYEPLLVALEGGQVRCPMSPAYNVLGNKGTLALLWEMAEQGELSDDEEALVRELIPHTVWLTPASAALAIEQQADHVLKPVDGFAGRDVVSGREMGEAEWRERLLTLAHSPRERFVLQRYVDTDIEQVTVVDESGVVSAHAARVVWGLYTFGDDYLGGFVRAKPQEATAIINGASGAAAGPLPRHLCRQDLEGVTR